MTGPTSSAEAIAKRGHWHDEFHSPNTGEAWHEQALQLVMDIDRSSSNRQATLLQQDLDELLGENGCK